MYSSVNINNGHWPDWKCIMGANKKKVRGTVLNCDNLDDMSELMFGMSNVEVECPECNDVREMEFDANWFECNCGLIVTFMSAEDMLINGGLV